MHPENFPARRNARQLAALGRIERQLASDVKRGRFATEPLTADDRKRLTREADALALRIRPEATLRAIRTKKTEANGWTPERTYRRRGKLAR